MSDVVCEENNYRGIPFTVYYLTDTPWDYVSPQNAGDLALGIFYSDGYRSNFINFPKDYIDDVQDSLYDACHARIKTLAKNLKKQYTPEEWAEQCADCTAEELATDYIAENYRETEPKALKELLDLAGVDYLETEYRGSGQGDYCEGILFRPDGRKITRAQHKLYKALDKEIKNWIYNEVYCVELPGASSEAAGEGPYLGVDYIGQKNCQIMDFVKKEVKTLLTPKSGKYVIHAPYANKNGSRLHGCPSHNYDDTKNSKNIYG